MKSETKPTGLMDKGMDDEQISEELTALMAHMASRGVTRQDGAYLFARLT